MRLDRRAARRVGGGVLATLLASGVAAPAPVMSVSPSGAVVPENLLRLSLRFAAPPPGPVLARLALVGRDGRPLPEPFLEQELWSPDGLTLTVLLHPGRVKTGLVARQAWGPILAEGDEVALILDGRPLRRWSVGPRDEQGPVPDAWAVSAVRAGRRDPLVVRLDAPIDALNAGYLAVVDERHRRVSGRAVLLDGETTWRFTPALPWRAGAYRLLARGTLEDASGNRVNGHFETGADERQERPADVEIPFDVAAGAAR
jgi:hypothetical protein